MLACKRIQDVPISPDFLEDTNVHKWAQRWASNYYKIIQTNMRSYSPEVIHSKMPKTFFFIKRFITYFSTYGLSPDDLAARGIQVIYRGVTQSVPIEWSDNGFSSTSFTLNVAKRFSTNASQQGTVLKFHVHELPKETKVVVIDNTIDRFFNEDEVLLMPGKFNTSLEWARFVPSNEYIAKFTGMRTPAFTPDVWGGGLNALTAIDLRGKSLIYWRALHKGPIETFSRLVLPGRAVDDFLKKHLEETEAHYEAITENIPGIRQLREESYAGGIRETKALKRARATLRGYTIHAAVVDVKKKDVMTIHFGVDRDLFEESFPEAVEKEQEIISFIKSRLHLYDF